jgi:NAD+ dependent glucose-6-phosphate dehydrogenase
MTRIVVTGAAGSIGRKLRHAFSGLDIDLDAIDLHPHEGAGIEQGDLTIWDADWRARFEGADAVIHLAGAASPDAPWSQLQTANIDATLHVFEVAARARVPRVVFASSNWVLAGHRFGEAPLQSRSEPLPVNGYGASKLVGERIARFYAEVHGLSTVCLRIGYCQHKEGNRPGPDMAWGLWGQQMWLSDDDLCAGFLRAATHPLVPSSCHVINLVSDNQGMRWDLSEAASAIGYLPKDASVPVETSEITRNARTAQRLRNAAAELITTAMEHRW